MAMLLSAFTAIGLALESTSSKASSHQDSGRHLLRTRRAESNPHRKGRRQAQGNRHRRAPQDRVAARYPGLSGAPCHCRTQLARVEELRRIARLAEPIGAPWRRSNHGEEPRRGEIDRHWAQHNKLVILNSPQICHPERSRRTCGCFSNLSQLTSSGSEHDKVLHSFQSAFSSFLL